MNREELLQGIARLEFINDQLTAEIDDIDQLMRAIGFSGGLQAVKQTAQELIAEGIATSWASELIE